MQLLRSLALSTLSFSLSLQLPLSCSLCTLAPTDNDFSVFPQLKRPRSWKKRSQRQVSQSTPVSAPGLHQGPALCLGAWQCAETVPARFCANAKQLAAIKNKQTNKKTKFKKRICKIYFASVFLVIKSCEFTYENVKSPVFTSFFPTVC